MSNHISAIPNLLSVIGATPAALIVSIKVIKRAASGHTNPANRRCPTLLVAQRPRRQLVSYDPTAGDRLSELWGRRGAQWETAQQVLQQVRAGGHRGGARQSAQQTAEGPM